MASEICLHFLNSILQGQTHVFTYLSTHVQTHVQMSTAPPNLGFQVKVQEIGQEEASYLQGILCVIQTVDPDAVLQGGAAEGPEDGQLQALGSCFGDRMTNQGIGAEVLCEDVAGVCVQLNVAGGSEVFLSNHHHLLGYKREEAWLSHHGHMLATTEGGQ
jgi:hypothetical protein